MKVLTVAKGLEVELLTVPEVAKSLDVHSETVRRAIWGGHMGSVRLGNRVFVRRDQLNEFLARSTWPVTNPIKRGPGRPKGSSKAVALTK